MPRCLVQARLVCALKIRDKIRDMGDIKDVVAEGAKKQQKKGDIHGSL